jgi:hypothetical protein
MFYTQCNNCNERWELGTTNICTCVTNGSATILIDSFSHFGQRTWVGLTEAECGVLWKVDMTPFDYYQAIEAKLKEKNT